MDVQRWRGWNSRKQSKKHENSKKSNVGKTFACFFLFNRTLITSYVTGVTNLLQCPVVASIIPIQPGHNVVSMVVQNPILNLLYPTFFRIAIESVGDYD